MRTTVHILALLALSQFMGCQESKSSRSADRAAVTSAVEPSYGGSDGGDTITITLNRVLNSAVSVLIDGQPCVNLLITASDKITCATPPGAIGPKEVLLTVGSEPQQLVGTFTYLPALAITTVEPSIGKQKGGETLVISGTGFVKDIKITIGALACIDVYLASDTALTCTAPAQNTSGLVDVVVQNTNGRRAIKLQGFSILDLTTVTAISPSEGPLNGGTTISIVGSGFSTGMKILIGASQCGEVVVANSYSATCKTGSGSTGTKPVTIVAASGEQASILAAYTYVAPPVVASSAPATGKLGGGTALKITGANFVDGAQVMLGTTACSAIEVESTESIKCVTPAGVAGQVSIKVLNPDGQEGTLNNGFHYLSNPAPSFSSISPNYGPRSGATTITITGSGYFSGISATIGGNICGDLVVVNQTTLTCTTPSGTLGSQDISLTGPDGQSTTTLNAFTYSDGASPVVTATIPNFGPVVGGTTITVIGASFQTGATITIGGITCGTVTRISGSKLTCSTPAGSYGARNVIVANPDGQSVTVTNGFSYINGLPPSISSVNPNNGPVAGNTSVTVLGANFAADTIISIGTVTCSTVTYVSSTQLTCLTPPGSYGARNVVITNPDGQAITGSNLFTYSNGLTPTISSLLPNYGPVVGGTTITVNGSNFANGAVVQIAGVTCATTIYVSSTQLTCLTPPGSYGAKIVTVINTDALTVSLTNAFTFSNGLAPTLTTLVPNFGNITGGDTIAVIGSGFVSDTVISIGGINCASLSYISTSQINCLTPSGTWGARTVSVANPDGQSGTLSSGFTYSLGFAPIVSSVMPITGGISGGTTISIIGSGFAFPNSNPTIQIGGISCNSAQIVSSTLATCITPPGTVGLKNVVLVNPDNQIATASNSFNYQVKNSFKHTINGANDEGLFGSTAISVGDINADGIPDIAIGAPGTTVAGVPRAGIVQVFSGLNVNRLCTIAPQTPVTDGSFGFSLASGLMVGSDSIQDLAIGIPGETVTSLIKAGSVEIYNLTSCTAGSTISTPTQSLSHSIPVANGRFGYAIAVGHIGVASTIEDIVIGEPTAPVAGTEQGRVSVFTGESWTQSSFTGSPAINDYSWLGWSVAVIDLNGDGNGEVVIGEPGANGAGLLRGRVHLLSSALDWTTPYLAALTSSAPADQARYGYVVANAGKLNHDSNDDLLVSEPFSASGAGKIFAYSIPSTSTTLINAVASPSAENFSNFGRSIAKIGDFNSDGRSDFVVGQMLHDAGGTDRGRFMVFSGFEAATYGSLTPILNIAGLENFSNLGSSVAAAGDLNGDGAFDLIVSEPNSAAGGARRGRIFTLLAP